MGSSLPVYVICIGTETLSIFHLFHLYFVERSIIGSKIENLVLVSVNIYMYILLIKLGGLFCFILCFAICVDCDK